MSQIMEDKEVGKVWDDFKSVSSTSLVVRLIRKLVDEREKSKDIYAPGLTMKQVKNMKLELALRDFNIPPDTF